QSHGSFDALAGSTGQHTPIGARPVERVAGIVRRISRDRRLRCRGTPAQGDEKQQTGIEVFHGDSFRMYPGECMRRLPATETDGSTKSDVKPRHIRYGRPINAAEEYMTALSILELVRVTEETDARGALDNARDLAAHAENWGYQRIWV